MAKTICNGPLATTTAVGLTLPTIASAQSLDEVLEACGLTRQDRLAAAKTYTPTGGRDEFIVFSSAGQSGQVMV